MRARKPYIRTLAATTAVMGLVTALVVTVLASTSGISIVVNGVALDQRYQPQVIDTQLMIPVQALVDAFGGQVLFSEDGTELLITLVSVPSPSDFDTGASASAPDSPPDVTVYLTRTGSKYHRAGCQHLAKSAIPIGLSEAKAEGYSPCSVCNPPS